MKSILHLKEDTEYQIPLRETETETEKDDKRTDRAKVDVAAANPEVGVKKETEVEKAEKAANGEKVNDEEETAATQSQGDSTANKETDEITQEEVDDKEKVNNENDPALDNLEEENPNPEDPSNTENSSNDTNTESVPQVDSAKAALDEMKKLASQEGVIHPSLFISNFSKILGLMERAMQLQVKESGSVTKEEAPETTEQTETPVKDK